VIRVRQASPGERAQEALAAYRQARKQLRGSYVAKSGPFTRRAVRQSATVLASQGAGFGARIWGATISRRLFH